MCPRGLPLRGGRPRVGISGCRLCITLRLFRTRGCWGSILMRHLIRGLPRRGISAGPVGCECVQIKRCRFIGRIRVPGTGSRVIDSWPDGPGLSLRRLRGCIPLVRSMMTGLCLLLTGLRYLIGGVLPRGQTRSSGGQHRCRWVWRLYRSRRSFTRRLLTRGSSCFTGLPRTPHPGRVPRRGFQKGGEFFRDGWSSSTVLAGVAGMYKSATVHESAVILTDSLGGTHSYTKNSAGWYTPAAGESGVVSVGVSAEGKRQVSFTDSEGTVYVFDEAGRVLSAMSADDVKHPVAPVMQYNSHGVVTRVVDRVSRGSGAERAVSFFYGGDRAQGALAGADPDGSGSACPVSDVFPTPPPAGKFGRVVYPWHVPGRAGDPTRLFYDSAGRLVSVVDPGNEQVLFSYDANRRLSGIRDSTETDWLRADRSRRAPDTNRTTISYTAEGRAASVMLAAPDGITAARQP